MLALELGAHKHKVALVPVAAILVASIRLHGLNTLFHTRYKGQADFACNIEFEKGQELGWFEHGSTIIVFAPDGFTLAEQILPGAQIKMGSPLMQLPPEAKDSQASDDEQEAHRTQATDAAKVHQASAATHQNTTESAP